MTIDVQSPYSGKILKLYAEQGSEVQVGKPFITMEEGAGAPAAKKETAPVTPSAPAPSTPAAPAKKAEQSAPAPTTPAPKTPTPEKVGDRSENRVKMTRMRQRIAERSLLMNLVLTNHRLKSAQNVAAMLTTFQEVDMGPLMDMRNKHKEEFEKKHGVKLGFMSAFVKVHFLPYNINKKSGIFSSLDGNSCSQCKN